MGDCDGGNVIWESVRLVSLQLLLNSVSQSRNIAYTDDQVPMRVSSSRKVVPLWKDIICDCRSMELHLRWIQYPVTWGHIAIRLSVICSKEVHTWDNTSDILSWTDILTCPMWLSCVPVFLNLILLLLLSLPLQLLFALPLFPFKLKAVFFQLQLSFFKCELSQSGFSQSFIQKLEIPSYTPMIPWCTWTSEIPHMYSWTYVKHASGNLHSTGILQDTHFSLVAHDQMSVVPAQLFHQDPRQLHCSHRPPLQKR